MSQGKPKHTDRSAWQIRKWLKEHTIEATDGKYTLHNPPLLEGETIVMGPNGWLIPLRTGGLGGGTPTSGTQIKLVHTDGDIETFTGNDAGMDLAAAAVLDPKEEVYIPLAATITSIHALAGCVYYFPPTLSVTGKLSVTNNTRVYRLKARPTGSSDDPVVGIEVTAQTDALGDAYFIECDIAPVNTGAGIVHAVHIPEFGWTNLHFQDTKLNGLNEGYAPGYAIWKYWANIARVDADQGDCWPLAHPIYIGN